MKGFFNALKHGRLLSWVIAALCLMAIIGAVSPTQLPVVLYKLALVSVAAIIGYHLDRALFPYASPGSYLKDKWQKRETKLRGREGKPEYPVCDGYLNVFAMVVLRRALIVGAVILGVTLGL